MPDRIIPLVLQTPINLKTPTRTNGVLIDTLQRPLQDLRISVTDRCNFRCVYCMPRAVFNRNYPYLPSNALLTFEEITRLAKLLVAQGVTKIRLTGGEPLLRKNIEQLVSMLRQLTAPSGTPLDLTLTTNGALLAQKAQQLKDAGLDRVTVSLDVLDDSIFKRMNDADFSVAEVLHGLDVAHQVGLGPIKINMVVKADVNESQILPMARHFKNSPFIVRFIEYMDVGSSNQWTQNEVLASQTVLDLIHAAMPLVPVSSDYPSETAQRWKYEDGVGEIGVISSVSQAFCRDCTRLRLSTEGKLYTCLFATHGHDVRQLLRSHADDQQLSSAVARIWQRRDDRYSEIRGQFASHQQKIEMSYIGG